MASRSAFLTQAFWQECRLLLLNLEAEVSSLSRGGQQAGSIGIALEGTMVSGIMPFGPAYEKMEIGDVITAVDGKDVTPGTIVSAIAGEDEGEIQLQVRKKLGGDVIMMELVRACSARLLTAHSLAVKIHEVLGQFGEDSPDGREAHNPQSTRTKTDEEISGMLRGCVRVLQDLQQQNKRSECRQREQMTRVQKRMFLQLRQMQELMQAEVLSSAKMGREKRSAQRTDRDGMLEDDREKFMAVIKGSEGMLGQLETQLSAALKQLEETESKLTISMQENKVLLDEVERLGNKEEMHKKEIEHLHQLSSDDSSKDSKVARLLAEINRLTELNRQHEEQLEKVSQQIRRVHSGEKEVRDALLQSQEDISQLLIIAEEKEMCLQQTVSEKDRISREHDQACRLADGVKAEIKRLEGLLETLSKRQILASVVTDSLTTERDGLKEALATATCRLPKLETELQGFKKLCAAQKQLMQESSSELEDLRKKVWLAEQKMEVKPVHHTTDKHVDHKCILKPGTRPQATRESAPREYGVSKLHGRSHVAKEGEKLTSVEAQPRRDVRYELVDNAQVASSSSRTASRVNASSRPASVERSRGGYSSGVYSVPKAGAGPMYSSSRSDSRSPSPSQDRSSRSGTPTHVHQHLGVSSLSPFPPVFGQMHFVPAMPGVNTRVIVHHPPVSIGSVHGGGGGVYSSAGPPSPRATIQFHSTPASAKDKTAAWLQGLGSELPVAAAADAPASTETAVSARTVAQTHGVQR